MVRQNKEVHKRIELDTPGQILKMGMITASSGTATLGEDSTIENSSGTALNTATSIKCDGYIVVDIGGTGGYIPVFVNKTL